MSTQWFYASQKYGLGSSARNKLLRINKHWEGDNGTNQQRPGVICVCRCSRVIEESTRLSRWEYGSGPIKQYYLGPGIKRRIRVDRANRIIMDRGLVLLCYLPSHSIKCSATVNSGHSLLNLFLVKTSELFPREIAIR